MLYGARSPHLQMDISFGKANNLTNWSGEAMHPSVVLMTELRSGKTSMRSTRGYDTRVDDVWMLQGILLLWCAVELKAKVSQQVLIAEDDQHTHDIS